MGRAWMGAFALSSVTGCLAENPVWDAPAPLAYSTSTSGGGDAETTATPTGPSTTAAGGSSSGEGPSSTGANTTASPDSDATGSSSTGATTDGSGCPTVVDDFDSTFIDPMWVEYMAPELSVGGGVLRIDIEAPSGDYPNIQTEQLWDLSSGWFRVLIDQSPSVEDAQQMVSLKRSDNGGALHVLIENGTLVARWDEAGPGLEDYATIAFSPSQHQWLQLRGDGAGNVVFETSADGTQFEQLASVPSPFPLEATFPSVTAGNFHPLAEDTFVTFARAEICASG